jgi:hypothetical protein
MVMYYKDMLSVRLVGSKFQFKLANKLSLFPCDFDPSKAHHVISVEFASSTNASTVRDNIYSPFIKPYLREG